ncbi:MAG: hypothetical protein GWN00_19350 [Aliifodinibius sp.]|nr:hypothetical protein [Fodinibius sp.]NIV13222.1 hypothetical protein [Fodinibius sp.]NIY26883.1 hypothetical protein [Fodinibius sp.]
MQTTRDKYLFVGTNDGVYFTELSKDFWFSGGFQDREVSVLLEDPKDKIVFAGVEGSVYRVEFKF